MTTEVLIPQEAIHERLGLHSPKLHVRHHLNFVKFNWAGNTWIRRDDVLEMLKAEYEATEVPVLARLIKVFEVGTA